MRQRCCIGNYMCLNYVQADALLCCSSRDATITRSDSSGFRDTRTALSCYALNSRYAFRLMRNSATQVDIDPPQHNVNSIREMQQLVLHVRIRGQGQREAAFGSRQACRCVLLQPLEHHRAREPAQLLHRRLVHPIEGATDGRHIGQTLQPQALEQGLEHHETGERGQRLVLETDLRQRAGSNFQSRYESERGGFWGGRLG